MEEELGLDPDAAHEGSCCCNRPDGLGEYVLAGTFGMLMNACPAKNVWAEPSLIIEDIDLMDLMDLIEFARLRSDSLDFDL